MMLKRLSPTREQYIKKKSSTALLPIHEILYLNTIFCLFPSVLSLDTLVNREAQSDSTGHLALKGRGPDRYALLFAKQVFDRLYVYGLSH